MGQKTKQRDVRGLRALQTRSGKKQLHQECNMAEDWNHICIHLKKDDMVRRELINIITRSYYLPSHQNYTSRSQSRAGMGVFPVIPQWGLSF